MRVRAGAGIAVLSVLWQLSACSPSSDLLGDPDWTASGPFAESPRAEVLVTGLEDVRGLAIANGKVYLAEANGKVVAYATHGPFKSAQPIVAEAGKTDQRGAAFVNGLLLLARHGLGRVITEDVNPCADLLQSAHLTGPSGIAVDAGGTVFVSDDLPWPGPSQVTAFDSADYSRWVEKGIQRPFGAIYVLDWAHCDTPQYKVASRLRHPSGIVAADSPATRLYVVESDSAAVYWTIVQKTAAGWEQAGSLGSAATNGVALPSFLGIALDTKNGLIFAAGPNSLYVFKTSGTPLGRICFEESVTGVATDPTGNFVYFMAGHRLCRLRWK